MQHRWKGRRDSGRALLGEQQQHPPPAPGSPQAASISVLLPVKYSRVFMNPDLMLSVMGFMSQKCHFLLGRRARGGLERSMGWRVARGCRDLKGMTRCLGEVVSRVSVEAGAGGWGWACLKKVKGDGGNSWEGGGCCNPGTREEEPGSGCGHQNNTERKRMQKG